MGQGHPPEQGQVEWRSHPSQPLPVSWLSFLGRQRPAEEEPKFCAWTAWALPLGSRPSTCMCDPTRVIPWIGDVLFCEGAADSVSVQALFVRGLARHHHTAWGSSLGDS